MFERSESHGIPERSASASASLKRRERGLRRCSAGSGRRRAAAAPGRARDRRSRPTRTIPRAWFEQLRAPGADRRRACAPGRDRPSARTSSSGTPVARAAATSGSNAGDRLLVARRASYSASARASAPSSRPRSSVATPWARKPASTPSRAASHSTVSRGRTRLAALDLGDVLLREPVARELALRQPGRDPKLAQALAEPDALRGRRAAAVGAAGGVTSRHAASREVNPTLHQSAR